MSNGNDQSRRKAAKRERNDRDYRRAKREQDHVLLRLDKGGADSLDAASHAAGLSRSAFARLYLDPLISAISTRLPEIERARGRVGLSLAQFLSRAIDEAIVRSAKPPADAPEQAAAEFDALFGSFDGGG
jgi:hypothetical protein